MKKRFVVTVLSMSLAASLLAGCGGKEPAADNTTTVQAQAPPVAEEEKTETTDQDQPTEAATDESTEVTEPTTEAEGGKNEPGESGVTTVDGVNPPIDEETGEVIAPTEEATPTEEAKPTEAAEDKKEDTGSASNSKYDEAFRAKLQEEYDKCLAYLGNHGYDITEYKDLKITDHYLDVLIQYDIDYPDEYCHTNWEGWYEMMMIDNAKNDYHKYCRLVTSHVHDNQ